MKILLLVDFSDTAKNAAYFASSLAQATGSSIVMAHIVEPIPENSEFLDYLEEEQIRKAKNKLNEWKKLFQQQFGLKYSLNVKVGIFNQAIKSMEKQLKPTYIVMGTSGSSGAEKFFWGSNTISTIENSTVPVLAIPNDYAYHAPKKIVYATDYNNSDIDDIKELTNFARFFDAEVLVVHITHHLEEEEDKYISMRKYFADLVHKNVFYPKLHCSVSENVSRREGISQFFEKEQADILAISMKKRNIFQKMASRSLTKKFIYDIKFPILAFHVTKKKESFSDF